MQRSFSFNNLSWLLQMRSLHCCLACFCTGWIARTSGTWRWFLSSSSLASENSERVGWDENKRSDNKYVGKGISESYMKEDTDGVTPTNCVVKFLQVPFECVWISCLYDVHTHPVQRLNRLVDWSMFLIIMHIVEPMTMTLKLSETKCLKDKSIQINVSGILRQHLQEQQLQTKMGLGTK